MLINDLSAHIRAHEGALKEAIFRVLESGWVILGPEVKRFESLFASYLDAAYCVSVANGTDAIELALKAMGVKPNDQVATVANAGMYATTAILAIGAIPYFIEVDIETRNTTLEYVDAAISAGVKAVVITHLYGLAVRDIEKIAKLCARKNVLLLEDCAQASGAAISGKYVGTFGDAASFSFYPTKNLGALGDGGAVVTNSEKISQSILRLRQYGWTEKYQVQFASARNSRLDELQAAVLSVFLPNLENENIRRRAIANAYCQNISHPAVISPTYSGEEYVGHLFVVRSHAREKLREHLKANNIATEVHYPIPDYRQPLFGKRFEKIRLENTERLAQEIFTLPCYPEMDNGQIYQVINAVNSYSL
jgi:dTDP-3-amino-2,3,6-trideoxy-4-keto-D-glucose/dTDP-3-amino-3,4,6-trideoxy-alpha-D-glucose/dTDP-2,6-dideoxy-D-kanosamine transaminase